MSNSADFLCGSKAVSMTARKSNVYLAIQIPAVFPEKSARKLHCENQNKFNTPRFIISGHCLFTHLRSNP